MLEEELRAAAARGNLQDVTSLLKQGAKLAPDSSGRTALHLACAGGHTQIVKSLIHPKNVNLPDGVGRTAVQVAAAGGHVDVVSVLIKNGANVNLRDNLHGNTALHEASWHGFSQTVALLARNNADLDTKNSAGFAALHLACQNGHNQSSRELLLAGANPDVQNNYGDSSLHTSARYGHAGVARILISASCSVSDQNKNGDTCLHIAAAMGRRKMTTILLEAGCDPTIRNKQYETALDIATRKDLNEIIIILKSVRPHKSGKKKKKKKSSETSDSDKRSREEKNSKSDNCGKRGGKPSPWSPYGCHYYPDFSSFPSPKLDSLPGEPLGKGEQYYLDLAGNICKGPVGVGVTCHCANFLRDMEARLEKNNLELKQKIKLTRCRLEERVERTEGLLAHWLLQESPTHDHDASPAPSPPAGHKHPNTRQQYDHDQQCVHNTGKNSHKKHRHRSHSLDLLHNCTTDRQDEDRVMGQSGADSLDLIVNTGDTNKSWSGGSTSTNNQRDLTATIEKLHLAETTNSSRVLEDLHHHHHQQQQQEIDNTQTYGNSGDMYVDITVDRGVSRSNSVASEELEQLERVTGTSYTVARSRTPLYSPYHQYHHNADEGGADIVHHHQQQQEQQYYDYNTCHILGTANSEEATNNLLQQQQQQQDNKKHMYKDAIIVQRSNLV